MVRGIRSPGREVENLPHDPSCADESNLLNGIASVRGVTTALNTELGARLHIGLGETRAPVTNRLTCRGHHLAGMVPSHPTRVKFLFCLDPARWRAGPLAPQSHFAVPTMEGVALGPLPVRTLASPATHHADPRKLQRPLHCRGQAAHFFHGTKLAFRYGG